VFKLKILVIAGPTAAGKSPVALEVGVRFRAEIVSADSMQVYRYMDIGTAKPSADERCRVPHHLIDILDPDEIYSAGLFCTHARAVIGAIEERGNRAVVVGGTGLYIRALISGLIGPGPVNSAVRTRLQEEAARSGSTRLYQRLEQMDPMTARQVHPRDIFRIVRALAFYEETGIPVSVARTRHGFRECAYDVLTIGLTRNREELYRRIENRVDQMMTLGWKEEVERLLDMGYDGGLRALQSLGYRRLVECLGGRYEIAEAVALTKRDTRRFAKRQMTWFRSSPPDLWARYPEDSALIFTTIEKFWDN